MEFYSFLNIAALIIALITFVADSLSDYILMVQYGLYGFIDWCLLTLTFAFMPSIITMVFSLHWYNSDEKLSRGTFFIHVLQLGILYRYIQLIISGWKNAKTQKLCNEDDYNQKQNDVCLLRIFEAFLESAPQLVLQLYIMMSYANYSVWTSITAVSSVVSLGWGIAAYTRAQRCSRPDKKKLTFVGMALQAVWRISLISARVMSLSLAATVLSYWLILFLAIHFVCMLFWVVYQKTGFSQLIWEEYLFNFVMAIVYCFCFFNLKESRSRWRMTAFYTIIICENCGLLVVYLFYSYHTLWQVVAGVSFVFCMTILGLSCMFVYYSRFHPIGRIKFTIAEAEAGNVLQVEVNDPKPIRKLKKSRSICLVPRRPHSDSMNNTKSSVKTSSSDPGCSTSLYSPPPQAIVSTGKKRETLCSIQDLLENISSLDDLKEDSVSCLQPDYDSLGDSHTNTVEDRELGYCFNQNEIGIPLIKTVCLSEPNLADVISDTKISDVTDTDSNVTVIPAVEHLLECSGSGESLSCHDDYENLYDAVTQEAPPVLSKQCRGILEETQTTLPHDYENVAPINIHRDIIGIRHWKPYVINIGDHVHDYSTFKDKSKLTELTGNMDHSNLREREKTITMSMPDLNLPSDQTNALEEKEECVPPYMQTNPMMRFASLDDLSNYETIWVESCEDVRRSCKSGHSSLVATINNVRAKESLNNLYSRISDLSQPPLKPANSDMTNTEDEVIRNKAATEQTPKKMFLLRTPKSAGNRCRRTLSILLEKFEVSQWAALRTPVRRQVSFQHKTAKAFQAGIRVFHRPRVHTITPKKEAKEELRWDQSIRIERSPSVYPPVIGDPLNIPMPINQPLGEPVRRPLSSINLNGESLSKPLATTNSIVQTNGNQIPLVPLDCGDSGPRHSTPETSRHVPQISVLSILSSVVASPEDNYDSRSSIRMDSDSRRPLGENLNILNYQLPPNAKYADSLIYQLKSSADINSDSQNFNSENIRERQIM